MHEDAIASLLLTDTSSSLDYIRQLFSRTTTASGQRNMPQSRAMFNASYLSFPVIICYLMLPFINTHWLRWRESYRSVSKRNINKISTNFRKDFASRWAVDLLKCSNVKKCLDCRKFNWKLVACWANCTRQRVNVDRSIFIIIINLFG